MGKPSQLARHHPVFTDYLVDVDGTVYSPRGPLAPTSSGQGYRKVRVKHAGRWWNVRVHRLVLETFRRERLAHEHADHINADRTDNRLVNLRYLDHVANNQRRAYVRLGPGKMEEMRRLYETGDYHQWQLAEKFGVTQQGISRALKHNLGHGQEMSDIAWKKLEANDPTWINHLS